MAALHRSQEEAIAHVSAHARERRNAARERIDEILRMSNATWAAYDDAFPDGLVMEPVEHGGRKVWAIRDHSTLSNDTSTPKTDTASPDDATEVSAVSASAAAKELNLEGEVSGGRRVWAIRGMAQLDLSTLSCDPTGT